MMPVIFFNSFFLLVFNSVFQCCPSIRVINIYGWRLLCIGGGIEFRCARHQFRVGWRGSLSIFGDWFKSDSGPRNVKVHCSAMTQQLNSCFVRLFYPHLVDFCQCVVGPEGEARTYIKQWGDFIFPCVRTMTRAATRERLLRCNLCFFFFLIGFVNKCLICFATSATIFWLLGWAASKKIII